MMFPECWMHGNIFRLDLANRRRVRVVLGNRTCDLDSAVCALVQGLSEHLDAQKNAVEDLSVIPVMNIPKREYAVKTEVVCHLEKHNVPSDLLTFRNEIDLKNLSDLRAGGSCALEIVLVDHHDIAEGEGFLADSVVRVIDHRPQDPSWPWHGRMLCIDDVGSCATLVASGFLRNHPESLDAQISSFLRGPIVVDTCNFSKEAARATPLDCATMGALEMAGGLDSADRKRVYDELLSAKTDISKLTPDDLMIRDLKVVAGVPMLGMPILIENFLTLENSLAAVKRFADLQKVSLVVLLGMDLKLEKIKRDIALFSLSGDRLKDKVARALIESTQPTLELTLAKEISAAEEDFSLLHYTQGNLCATRKHILPIVRDALPLSSKDRDC